MDYINECILTNEGTNGQIINISKSLIPGVQ
jgi:hypothetical protein